MQILDESSNQDYDEKQDNEKSKQQNEEQKKEKNDDKKEANIQVENESNLKKQEKMKEKRPNDANYQAFLIIKMLKNLLKTILNSNLIKNIIKTIIELMKESKNFGNFDEYFEKEFIFFCENYCNILIPYVLPKGVSGITSCYGIIFIQSGISNNPYMILKQAAIAETIVHEFLHWLLRRLSLEKKITLTLSPSFIDFNNKFNMKLNSNLYIFY